MLSTEERTSALEGLKKIKKVFNMKDLVRITGVTAPTLRKRIAQLDLLPYKSDELGPRIVYAEGEVLRLINHFDQFPPTLLPKEKRFQNSVEADDRLIAKSVVTLVEEMIRQNAASTELARSILTRLDSIALSLHSLSAGKKSKMSQGAKQEFLHTLKE